MVENLKLNIFMEIINTITSGTGDDIFQKQFTALLSNMVTYSHTY